MDWLFGGLVLYYCGFVLIGNVDVDDCCGWYLGVVYYFGDGGEYVGEDFVGVVFDLVWLWKQLVEFVLCYVCNVVGVVEQDGV